MQTAREKLKASSLLHGRFGKAVGFYQWIKLIGRATVNDDGQVEQRVELWGMEGEELLPQGEDTLKLYESGLGDLDGPVLDGTGNNNTLYRIGVKEAGKYSRGPNKGKPYYNIRVTARRDTAQQALPTQPTSSESEKAPGGPHGGPQQSYTYMPAQHSMSSCASMAVDYAEQATSNGVHSDPPTPPRQGAGPVTAAQRSGTSGEIPATGSNPVQQQDSPRPPAQPETAAAPKEWHSGIPTEQQQQEAEQGAKPCPHFRVGIDPGNRDMAECLECGAVLHKQVGGRWQ